MRLFVAILPTEEALTGLNKPSQLLRERITRQGVRFTPPEKLHVTLKFLGSVEPERLPALIDSLKRACEVLVPFDIEALHLGCFPSVSRPKVVWSDVSGVPDSLLNSIREATEAFAERIEKDGFSTHMTLARVSPPSQKVGRALTPLLESTAEEVWAAWEVEKLFLMESVPGGGYAQRAVFPLQADR